MHRWLTRHEVAEKLGIHLNTLFKLEKKPGFPRRSSALGGPRWREDEIDRYMEHGRQGGGRSPSLAEPQARIASIRLRGAEHGH